jgi:hypothetical protein
MNCKTMNVFLLPQFHGVILISKLLLGVQYTEGETLRPCQRRDFVTLSVYPEVPVPAGKSGNGFFHGRLFALGTALAPASSERAKGLPGWYGNLKVLGHRKGPVVWAGGNGHSVNASCNKVFR